MRYKNCVPYNFGNYVYQWLRYLIVCPANHPIKTVVALLNKVGHLWTAGFCPIYVVSYYILRVTVIENPKIKCDSF